ncbi:MAG: hypothetical protein WC846_02735 [Candidatus Gracilibacteria bacterium]|jgi:hypothetical protein
MKKKYLAFVLALVVMAGAGVAYTQNMGDLQGKFHMGAKTVKMDTVKTAPTTPVPPPSGTSATGTLTVSVASTTPREDILVAGDANQKTSAFTFTGTGEAFTVTDLSLNNAQEGVTAMDLGENDDNVVAVTLSYKDKDGTTKTASGYLVSGTAAFSGLDFYIGKDSMATLEVYADLNTIPSGADAGGYINLNLAFNDFEAIGEDSGATIDASTLDFGTTAWTNGSSDFRLDGAQTLTTTLGGTSTLTVDNGSGDNTNKLPVGTLICVDDDTSATCSSEDIYVVLGTTESTAKTEDSLSVKSINDAGDYTYDDNDPLLYALPGTGYLTSTNRMYIYETKPTLALASSSPSGSQSVSATDDAFEFTITADTSETVRLFSVKINMTSDNDFNSAIKTTPLKAYLKEEFGATVATGTVSYVDANNASVTFYVGREIAPIKTEVKLPTLPKMSLAPQYVEIAKGTPKTFTLEIDTATLLDEDTGEDDPLIFSIDYGSSADGVVTSGGLNWSDTNVTGIKWLGNVGFSALTGNTVLY